ncbi:MAG: tetraacyldisaccharide 4'-kinase, partial [Mesorhizobium sp.]
SFARPHVVDPHHDAARHVGDEPLLLAAHAPVAVTPNRAAGARLLLEKHGCDFLIMDDGFQSARIHIDYALVVVDARYGVGNGRVIPGGPL